MRYYLDEGDPVVFLDLQDILREQDTGIEVIRVEPETLLAPVTRLGRSVFITSRRLADLLADDRVPAFAAEGGRVLRIGGRRDAKGLDGSAADWLVLERPFTDAQFLRALKDVTRP